MPHLAVVSPAVLQNMSILLTMLTATVQIGVIFIIPWNTTRVLAVRTEYVVGTVLPASSLFFFPNWRGSFLEHQCKIRDLIRQHIYLGFHILDPRIWTNQQSRLGRRLLVESVLCLTSFNARFGSTRSLVNAVVLLDDPAECVIVCFSQRYQKLSQRLKFFPYWTQNHHFQD